MASSLGYCLKPSREGAKWPLDLVDELAMEARQLPFEKVDKVVHLFGEDIDYRIAPRHLRGLLLQTGRVTGSARDRRLGSRVWPLEVIAFSARPGPGYDEAHFGLCQYPAQIRTSDGCAIPTSLEGWQWQSSCKLLRAHDPEARSMLYRLKGHMSLIALLDGAKRIGFDVDAQDPTGFWNTRNPKALTPDIAEWNRFLASIGGSVAQPALTPDAFEALSAEGLVRLATVVDLIRRTAAA